jgi:hypothetical protein
MPKVGCELPETTLSWLGFSVGWDARHFQGKTFEPAFWTAPREGFLKYP